MKVIISEQRINNVIKKLLMNNIEDIKSVNFFDKDVLGVENGKRVLAKDYKTADACNSGNIKSRLLIHGKK